MEQIPHEYRGTLVIITLVLRVQEKIINQFWTIKSRGLKKTIKRTTEVTGIILKGELTGTVHHRVKSASLK